MPTPKWYQLLTSSCRYCNDQPYSCGSRPTYLSSSPASAASAALELVREMVWGIITLIVYTLKYTLIWGWEKPMIIFFKVFWDSHVNLTEFKEQVKGASSAKYQNTVLSSSGADSAKVFPRCSVSGSVNQHFMIILYFILKFILKNSTSVVVWP